EAQGVDELGEARFLCSQAVALAFQGVPAIYFHSLMGAPNWIEGLEEPGAENRTINRRKWNRDELQQELDNADSHYGRIFTQYSHMLRRRQGRKAFHPSARMRTIDVGPEFFCFIRTATDASESILCIYNFTPEVRKIPMSQFEEYGLSTASGSV